MSAKLEPDIHQEVQKYYGEVLQSSQDLKTSACCTAVQPEDFVKAALAEVHDDVHARYYGCGLALPEKLAGLRVLDLGCGAGRDVYLLSRLVGETGHVVGVDMTDAQLSVARRYQGYHQERFGYARSNVEFVEGNIERLGETGLESGSFDAIVSNCVINLAIDKLAVLQEAFRLLREGGEMYFADVYTDRRVPAALAEDPVLYGECLSGALYWRDFLALAQQAGFAPPQLVESHPIDIEDPEVAARAGDIGFCSATYRVFKAAGSESTEEDYGLQAVYLGTVPNCPESLGFSLAYSFAAGKATPVSGNLARTILGSRFVDDFEILGSFSEHLGAFDDKRAVDPFTLMSTGESGQSCC